MYKTVKTILLLYLFWLLLFLCGRVFFILHQYNFELPANALKILFAGLRLDWSSISYLVLFPALLIVFNLFVAYRLVEKIFYFLHYLLVPLVLTLTISNIVLYKSWNTLLNAKALLYALQPTEMIASLTTKQLISLLLILFIAALLFVKLFRTIIRWEELSFHSSTISKAVFSFVLLATVATGIRGGLQELPINESVAIFSDNQIQNDIATNNIWYLGNSIMKSGFESANPYNELNTDEATKIVEQLYARDTAFSRIINTNSTPNIVLLLLESWTADIIEPLDGLKNITPFFTSLADSGLLFTEIYATGRRTDQALPSLISGFPSQPDRSIMRYTDKIRKLPSITNELSAKGYSSSFYYGGNLAFNNMHTFLLTAGFDKITGIEAFANNQVNSKWGAHDEYVLMKQATDLSSQKKPFFSMLLTLTSHEPFEIPTAPKFVGKNDSALFINAVNYSDQSLRKYFAFAKTQPWYSNTLFVLIADHGHLLPLNREYYDPRSRKIPLLFYGDLLKQEFKGRKDTTIGNQNDITTTLLNQLGIYSKQFVWSNDLLNHSANHFAYINADKYFCWKWNNGYYRYNSESRKVEEDAFLTNQDKNEIQKGVAYRQKLLDTFIAY